MIAVPEGGNTKYVETSRPAIIILSSYTVEWKVNILLELLGLGTITWGDVRYLIEKTLHATLSKYCSPISHVETARRLHCHTRRLTEATVPRTWLESFA